MSQSNQEDYLDPSASDTGTTADGIDIWGIILRGKWIILVSAALGAAFGYLYYLRLAPVYQSTSRLLIERRRPALPLESIGSSFEQLSVWEDSQKHSLLIKSPRIVRQSIENHRLTSLYPSISGTSIIKNLQLAPVYEGGVKSSSIFDMTLTGLNAEKLPKVINAITDTYRRFLEATYQDVNRDTRELIVEAKDDLLH